MNLNRKKFLDDLQVIEKLLATSHIDKDIFWMKRKENNLFLVAFGGVCYLELSMSPYAEIEG